MSGREFHILLAKYENLKSADRKLLFFGWGGPGYDSRANCRMKTDRTVNISFK